MKRYIVSAYISPAIRERLTIFYFTTNRDKLQAASGKLPHPIRKFVQLWPWFCMRGFGFCCRAGVLPPPHIGAIAAGAEPRHTIATVL